MTQKYSLGAGFRSYEEKIKMIIKALLYNGHRYVDLKVPVTDLALMIGVQVKFMLAPLKYLSSKNLINVTIDESLISLRKIENYKISITGSGKVFYELFLDSINIIS